MYQILSVHLSFLWVGTIHVKSHKLYKAKYRQDNIGKKCLNVDDLNKILHTSIYKNKMGTSIASYIWMVISWLLADG